MLRLLPVLATCLASLGIAHADDAPAEPEPTTRPEDAHGIRSGQPVPEDPWVQRSLLFVPRAVTAIALSPARLAVWMFDRLELRNRFYRTFFNDEGTVGVYPVVFFQSGFGVHGGVRFVHRDLFGAHEKLSLRVGYGGVDSLVGTVSLASGHRLRGIQLGLGASYVELSRSRFFGYGNGDEVAAAAMTGIDPLADDTAVSTRFDHDSVVAALDVVAHPARVLTLRLRPTYRHMTIGGPDAEDVDLASVYDPMAVPGFASELDAAAVDLDVVLDTRRTRYFFQSPVTPSSGWRVFAFGRYEIPLDGELDRFVRYGIDVERDLDLYAGDRVLVLRAHAEGVTGDLRRIPFVDVPALGGATLLRGYPSGRFRDRYAGVVSADYAYPVAPYVRGYLGVDAGRVWRDRDDLELGLDELRVGFGGGLVVHSERSFLADLSVFSSIDGGLELRVGFTSSTERRAHR